MIRNSKSNSMNDEFDDKCKDINYLSSRLFFEPLKD